MSATETIILVNAYQKAAQEYMEKNLEFASAGSEFTETEKQHVARIGASVLMTRDKVGYPGGGFVHAIVENNLSASIARADKTCIKALKFFIMLKESCQVHTPRL